MLFTCIKIGNSHINRFNVFKHNRHNGREKSGYNAGWTYFEMLAKLNTLLANCQRNRLAIACRHKSACYIAEVLTFIALLLISCNSSALSYQTTCFYINKNFSDCLWTTTSCSYAVQCTTWAVCLLVIHRDYSVTWVSKWFEKKIIFIDFFTYV